jgi:hypothetical protein
MTRIDRTVFGRNGRIMGPAGVTRGNRTVYRRSGRIMGLLA